MIQFTQQEWTGGHKGAATGCHDPSLNSSAKNYVSDPWPSNPWTHYMCYWPSILWMHSLLITLYQTFSYKPIDDPLPKTLLLIKQVINLGVYLGKAGPYKCFEIHMRQPSRWDKVMQSSKVKHWSDSDSLDAKTRKQCTNQIQTACMLRRVMQSS